MKSRIALCLLSCALVTFLVSGCAGYHLGASKPKSMAYIKTIAVPVFKNDTLESRVEALAANIVIKQLQQDGTYTIAPADSADAILQGTITKIQRDPARSVHGNVDATREFELVVRVDFTLTRRTTKQEIDDWSFTGQTPFFVGGDIQQQERQAFPLAMQEIAVSVASTLAEGW